MNTMNNGLCIEDNNNYYNNYNDPIQNQYEDSLSNKLYNNQMNQMHKDNNNTNNNNKISSIFHSPTSICSTVSTTNTNSNINTRSSNRKDSNVSLSTTNEIIISNNNVSSIHQKPFDKLNTLKLLVELGHINEDEYKERKNQIINEMTGTSSILKPSPKVLRPILKTVVPHNPPDFSNILQEKVDKLSFDVETLEWNSTSFWIKLDYIPFATGQLRYAYFLQEIGPYESSNDMTKNISNSNLLVAKISIKTVDDSSYFSDVEMQAVCSHYAKLYNEHDPPLKVQYAKSWILQEYIPGSYVKYSNNYGFVGTETSSTEERERNTPQAFSHFTFVASDYRLMAVDIQGVNDSYTDPQIHTADGIGFGSGNLGSYGIEKFLQTHRCNEVCRWLGLKSLNKQFKAGGTAAPAYQMPLKSIKKSNNRISTNHRNGIKLIKSNGMEIPYKNDSKRISLYERFRHADLDLNYDSGSLTNNSFFSRVFYCCFR